MKLPARTLITLFVPALLAAATAAGRPLTAKPNIIVILSDDHGYADLGCQGQLQDIRTPHLDRLAADGVRCTNGYVTAPQCIPSRAGLLTGRHQARFGVDHNGTIPLPLDEVLVPQRLLQAGYTTGMVGKWHLDPNHQQQAWLNEHLPQAGKDKRGRVAIPHAMIRPYLPDRRGFKESFCGQINSYWATYRIDGGAVDPPRYLNTPGYRLDIQTDAAITFIDRHAGEPFFLYLAYFAPHVPLDATAKYLDRVPAEMPRERRLALAMLAAIDDGVGRIRQQLDKHGLTSHTLIFFISDNGAPLQIDMKDEPGNGPGWDGSRNDPWIGEKGMLTEGGIRVPFVATWPGTLPAGRTYDHPISTLDVATTAVAVAGLPHAPELDGIDLIPRLNGNDPSPPRRALFWRFWNQSAVRMGRWKFLQAGPNRFLFDLASPQHETKNLIAQEPEMARELEAQLTSWAAGLATPGIPDTPLAGTEKKWFDHYLPDTR